MAFYGILFGLGAAVMMAMAAISSGRAVRRSPEAGAFGVLIASHIWAGILAALGLVILWDKSIAPGFASWFPICIMAAVFYLIGQWLFFIIQKQVDSSRIVPLLGVKLIFLALINGCILKKEIYGWPQYLGVLCTIASAFVMVDKKSGRPMSLMNVLTLLVLSMFYALSDISLDTQYGRVDTYYTGGRLICSMLNTCLTYTLVGVGTAAFLLPFGRKILTRRVWLDSLPYGVFWLAGIAFLFASFSIIGPVNGAIAQSTRGIFAILIGALIAKHGFSYLEEKVTPSIFWHRIFSAVLMILAMVFFNMKR